MKRKIPYIEQIEAETGVEYAVIDSIIKSTTMKHWFMQVAVTAVIEEANRWSDDPEDEDEYATRDGILGHVHKVLIPRREALRVV